MIYLLVLFLPLNECLKFKYKGFFFFDMLEHFVKRVVIVLCA